MLACQLNKLVWLDKLLNSCCYIHNKPNYEVWLLSGSYKLPNKLSWMDDGEWGAGLNENKAKSASSKA